MTKRIKATGEMVEKISRYNRAKAAKTRWQQEEDDPKPDPLIAEDDTGTPVFEVKRGTWRGLNQKYLKQHHPEVYAECEASKSTLQIKYEEV